MMSSFRCEFLILFSNVALFSTTPLQSKYPELNRLTLSPTDYELLQQQNSPDLQNQNLLLSILWFAVAYVALGIIFICIEFVKGKKMSISLLFIFFIFQGGLDIMDVSSDYVAANQLMSGSGNQCGWTQCNFPDIFSSYGQALIVCVILGGIFTLITATLAFSEIIKKICCSASTNIENSTATEIEMYEYDKKKANTISSYSDSDSDVSVTTKVDIYVTLLKLFFADLPAIIIYMTLWSDSWKNAGIGLSNITIVSFILTSVDIVYALAMIGFTLYHHNIKLSKVMGERCMCPSACFMCFLFVAVVVAIGLLIHQTTAAEYKNAVPRISIGNKCYDPYSYPEALIYENDDVGFETSKGFIFSDLVMLEINISSMNFSYQNRTYDTEQFGFDIIFVKDGDWNNSTRDWTADYIKLSSFDAVRKVRGDNNPLNSYGYSPLCHIDWSPYIQERLGNTPLITFKGSNIEYGCYDTIWNCSESMYSWLPIDYMQNTAVQICIDVCQWT